MLLFIASVLSYDIWFYISHRMLHSSLLYPYHAVHHENVDLTWVDTYHAHWMETPFQGIGTFFPLALGVPLNITEMGLTILYLNVRGVCQHEPRLSWLVGDHHVIHHQNQRWNFGQSWIDAWIGTSKPMSFVNV